MGQVPNTIYAIVGDGRVAKHFAHYFSLQHIPFKTWSRKLQNTQNVSPESLIDCDTILLLISDSQIQSFYDSNKYWIKSKPVFHFSGSLVSLHISGFHPLMTFGPDLYDLKTYKSITFVGEKNGPDFKKSFPSLDNRCFFIPREEKPLYHALCVMSGTFSVLLWQKLLGELTHHWDIPKDAALPYLDQVTKNLLRDPGSALTGPLQRKELVTIEKNRRALKEIPKNESFLKIYDAFVEAYL